MAQNQSSNLELQSGHMAQNQSSNLKLQFKFYYIHRLYPLPPQGSCRTSQTCRSMFNSILFNSWCSYFVQTYVFFSLYIIRVIFHFVMLNIRCEVHLSLITYVPLGFLRKLISKIHVKEYNNKLTLVIAPGKHQCVYLK